MMILAQQHGSNRRAFHERYVVGNEPDGVVPMPSVSLSPSECTGCWPYTRGWPEGKVALEHVCDIERCGGAGWVQWVWRERARLGKPGINAAAIQYDTTAFATPRGIGASDNWGPNGTDFYQQFLSRTWRNGPLANFLNDLSILGNQGGGRFPLHLHGLYEGNDIGHAPLNAKHQPIADPVAEIIRDLCLLPAPGLPDSCKGEVGCLSLFAGDEAPARDWYFWFTQWVANGIRDAIKHAGYAGDWSFEYHHRIPYSKASDTRRRINTPDGRTSHLYWMGEKGAPDFDWVLANVPGPIVVHFNMADGVPIDGGIARVLRYPKKVSRVIAFAPPMVDGTTTPERDARWAELKAGLLGRAE